MTPVHDAVLAVLEGGGGLFFRMIADRVAAMLKDHDWRGLSDTAVAAAIWDLVWAGRLTNDTLAPLRTVLGTGRPVYRTRLVQPQLVVPQLVVPGLVGFRPGAGRRFLRRSQGPLAGTAHGSTPHGRTG